MQVKPNRIKVKKKVNKLLDELKLTTIPIDLQKILKFLDLEHKGFLPQDLKLKDTDPNKVSAFIDYDSNIIFYNKKHPKNRLRFSIAHEVGHYMLEHKYYSVENHYNPKHPFELEANLFASYLLMPSQFMEKEVVSNEADINKLALKYAVSLQAMKYRVITDDKLLGVSFDYLGYNQYKLKQESEDF